MLLRIILRRRNGRNGRFWWFFIHQKKEIQFITLQKFTIKELLQRITTSMCANKAKICMWFVDSLSAKVTTKSPIEEIFVFFSSCSSTKSFFEYWNPPIWKIELNLLYALNFKEIQMNEKYKNNSQTQRKTLFRMPSNLTDKMRKPCTFRTTSMNKRDRDSNPGIKRIHECKLESQWKSRWNTHQY